MEKTKLRNDHLRRIVSLLWDRRADSYEPGSRSDGNHIALVIEGGGMLGVTAGGMVSALEDLGLLHSFDSVHGSSAGAATGAYFLTGQARVGTSLFYEDLNNRQFINPLRMLTGGPVLDTSFFVDDAMIRRKIFDFGKLARSRCKLYVTCTDIDEGAAYTVSDFHDYDHYRRVLKASITMPLLAGSSVSLDGRRLLDGGLVEQIALSSAEKAGATDILALVTRTDREMVDVFPRPITYIESHVLGLLYGGKVQELYYNRDITINDQIKQLHQGSTRMGRHVGYVCLPSSLDWVGRLTIDKNRLKESAHHSYNHLRAIFESVKLERTAA